MQYFTDCEKSMDLREVNRAIETAFADHGRGLVQMPPKVYITLPEGDFRTMPAYLPSLSLAGVKVVNVHPGNPSRGLPTVMALTVILDIKTGIPVAILNATKLTDMRTGAAGAVAAKYLTSKKEIADRYRKAG
jgi:alanine dehydrogenase